MFDNTLAKNVLALAIGVVGYWIAEQVGFPAPALTGPAFFVSIVAVAGLRLDITVWLRNTAFVFIGIAMGTSVTPDVIEAAKRWPESFLLMGIGIVVIFFSCRFLLRHYWNLDHQTSALASTPGHMSYVLSLSVESKADIATVSVIQSIRVLALTLIVPLLVTLLGYEPVIQETDAATVPVLTVALVGLAAVGCAIFFERIGLAAAYLLAGMFVSTLVFVTGTAEGTLPEWIYLPTIVVMGTVIGTRLSGVSKKTLRTAATSGLVLMLVAVLSSAFIAGIYAWWSGLPFGQLLIAFAPGGLETMIAMSLLLDADPAYVAAHHVWRLVILTFLAPVMITPPKSERGK